MAMMMFDMRVQLQRRRDHRQTVVRDTYTI
jgi:hypothetical protein